MEDQQETQTPLKSAKESSKYPNWKKFSDGLFPTFRKDNPITDRSGMVLLRTSKGRVIPGFVDRYLNDYSFFRFQAAKGDVYFSSWNNVPLVDVVSWEYLPK